MRILSRLTYANVMATVAMFLALGGTSYAAVKLSADSVTSPTIADGSVATQDLADGAVTSAKVRDRSLSSRDFAPGTLTAGPRGPQGGPGVGLKGDKGDPGPAGASVTRTLEGRVAPGGTEVVFDDATFTQKAGEFLFIVGIRFKVTARDFICVGRSPHVASAGVQLAVDGRGIGGANVNYALETFKPGQVDLVERAQWQAAAYAPAVDTPRTLSGRVYASCDPGDPAFPGISDVEAVLASVG